MQERGILLEHLEYEGFIWYNYWMGFLDRIKDGASGIRDRAGEIREDLAEAVELMRNEIKERVQLARDKKGDGPTEIKSDPVDFGRGIKVFQKDEDTIVVGSKEYTTKTIMDSPNSVNMNQHDLDLDFLPFGWSCKLGQGKDAVRVFAYEGRNNGRARLVRVLVVKNLQGQIVKVILPR